PILLPPIDESKLDSWYRFGLNRWFRVEAEGFSAVELAEMIEVNKDILSVEILKPAEAHVEPNDYNYRNMWGLDAMFLPDAWDIHHGYSTVIISTIDTGCRIDHPDLAANMYINPGEDVNQNGFWDEEDNNGADDDFNGKVDDIVGWDFVSYQVNDHEEAIGEEYGPPDNEIFPDVHGHGTHVAGTAAAVTNNDVGVASASWNVKSLPLRAGFAWIDDHDRIQGSGYWDDFADGVQYATDMGARVISISFGGSEGAGVFENALQYARDNNVLVFSSAGNSDNDDPSYPAYYPTVLAVAAVEQNETKWVFSNFGEWIALSAPGSAIWSTMSNNEYHGSDYASWSGTSMASPNAAAVAGLLLNYNPFLTDDEIEDIMLATCVNLDEIDPEFAGLLGAGRVNAHDALEATPEMELPAPTNLVGNVNNATGRVTLAWAFEAEIEVDHFRVYRDNQMVAIRMSPNFTEFLPQEGEYEYTVSAWYQFGESEHVGPLVIDWEIVIDPEHFQAVEETENEYRVFINTATLDENALQAGDEIGIFDGELCVGAVVVRFPETPVLVRAWGSTPEDPGYAPGNTIGYKVWEVTSNSEFEATPEYRRGDGTFGFEEQAEVDISAQSLIYFDPVPDTGRPYAIIVEDAVVEEEAIAVGDEIGIFDGELCVGARAFNGEYPFPMTAWQADDAQGLPGYTAQNRIRYEIWLADENITVPAEAAYINNMGNGRFGFGPYSDIILDGYRAHNLTIPLAGNYFELVSFNLTPVDLDAEEVFGEIADLAIVYDEFGGIYLPPFINTIGEVSLINGYQIFCRQASELTVSGERLDVNTIYSLNGGIWNWLGYPFTFEVPVAVALRHIEDFVDIVLSDDGGFWVPGVVNTMGNMQPGEGFFVFPLEDTDFIYNTNPFREGDIAEAVNEPWEIPAVQDAPIATGKPYAVLISIDESLAKLNPSIIELYDNNVLVGKSQVLEKKDVTPIVAWEGSQEFDLSGFTVGSIIDARVFDHTGQQLPAIFETSSRFGEGSYARVSLSAGELPSRFEVANAFPNPFNSTIVVPFSLPEEGAVEIAVWNLEGRRVFTELSEFEVGNHRYQVNFETGNNQFSTGTYFLTVSFDGNVKTQKIVLLK
ncbi:S8 family peptidase, partial [bacterium]|nr:S8 family peptidase [bacterium]